MSHRPRFATPAVIAAVLVAVSMVTYRLAASPAMQFAGYSARQVCADSVGLVHRLTLSDGGFKLAAEPVFLSPYPRPHAQAWIVDVTDMNGDYLAQLVRDGETGDVVGAGMAPRHGPVLPAHRMRASEAAAIGRRWLYDLGVAQPGSLWTVADTPEKTGDLWRAHFRSGGHLARMSIDARSGNLVTLSAWPRGGASMALVARR